MKEFIAVHDAAEQESIDPKGIAIRGPELGLTTKGYPDEIIDTVLTGSLSMVAAILQAGARQPGPDPKGAYTDDEAYVAAQEQIVRGIMMMEMKVRETRQRNHNQGAGTQRGERGVQRERGQEYGVGGPDLSGAGAEPEGAKG